MEIQQKEQHPPSSIQISGPPEIQNWTCTAPKSAPLVASRKRVGDIVSQEDVLWIYKNWPRVGGG